MKSMLLLSICLLLLSECGKKQTTSHSILIVAPHPDDETLGTGGQIALLTDKGYNVHIIVLTDGSQLFVSQFGTDTKPSPGEISNLRKRETERTVTHLGGESQNILYLDFLDGQLSNNIEEAARNVAAGIRDLHPDRVYVTSAFEFHPDHRAANTVVKRAYAQLTRDKPELWEYSVGPRPDFGPGEGPESLVEIDITHVLDRKTEAVSMFACHLELTVEGQTEPIWKDGSQYLSDIERFLVTPGTLISE